MFLCGFEGWNLVFHHLAEITLLNCHESSDLKNYFPLKNELVYRSVAYSGFSLFEDLKTLLKIHLLSLHGSLIKRMLEFLKARSQRML